MDFDDLGRKGILFIASLVAVGGGGFAVLGVGNDVVGSIKATAASVSSESNANQRYIDAKRQEHRGGFEIGGGLLVALTGLAVAAKALPQPSSPGGP